MKPTEVFITIMIIVAVTGYSAAHPVESPVSVDLVRASDTIEATPSATIAPEKPLTKFITVKVSHYWPDLGGVNCYNFKNGKCISKLANGERWEKNVGYAIACPPELKFGTRIRILDRVWTCKDRGSKITMVDGKYWVDQLSPESFVPYGSELEAEMYLD